MQTLSKGYDREQEQRQAPLNRLRALISGVEFINKLDYKLTSIELAAKLPVGKPFIKLLADHLPSIAREAPAISEQEKKVLLEELTSIQGLSHRRVPQLILAGCRSKSDLLRPKYFNMLPAIVQQNVRFASHLEKPVPRQQTETVVDFVREIFPKYEVIPVGSYRRDASTSTCVRLLILRDILYVPHPPAPPAGYLQPLLAETLQAPGLLRDAHLHTTIIPLLKETGVVLAPRLFRYWGWQGILRVPKRGQGGEGWETVQERVNGMATGEGEFVSGKVAMLPAKSRGAALLYHTGTQSFIRLIEHKATALGLYFDHTGLWKWHPDPSEEILGISAGPESDFEKEGGRPKKKREGKKEQEGKSIPKKKRGKRTLEDEKLEVLEKGKRAEGFWQLLPSADEESIFEQLGMEYIGPEKRGIEF
ncbi:hypothetical protein C0989_011677 [Termitomyces sp. Mn162]|nr:hypothetical protein C0989_011677 [Termitomyces sp. Mn162]